MRLRLIGLSAGVTSAIFMSLATPAMAYSGSGAASYADNNANQDQPGVPAAGTMGGLQDDCTNFVSGAFHFGGGLAEVKIGSLPATDDRQWFETFDSTGWHWSYSFTVAEDLYQFITGTGRGYYVGTENGDSLSQTLPAAMSYGDPLFYRWQFSHTAEDHVGVLAAYGYDPQSGWYGWLQDQHTTNAKACLLVTSAVQPTLCQHRSRPGARQC